MQFKKQQLEQNTEKLTRSKLGKEYIYCTLFILSPCLFHLHVEYIMQNAELLNYQLDSRLPGEISTTSDMQMKSL